VADNIAMKLANEIVLFLSEYRALNKMEINSFGRESAESKEAFLFYALVKNSLELVREKFPNVLLKERRDALPSLPKEDKEKLVESMRTMTYLLRTQNKMAKSY
jgi:hypothetical protein